MNFFDFIFEKKNFILIVSLILNGLLISISGYLLWNNINYECKECVTDNLGMVSNEETIKDEFYIEIKGAVKKPGVYLVNSNNIINDVITMAEGFIKKAYTKNINLSKKVSNELVIYVYTESEYKKLNEKKTETVIIKKECICPSYEITDCINSGNSLVVPDEKIENDNEISSNTNIEEPNTNNNLININTASIDELMNLNGIGESKANAIIEYRNKTKFNTIDDIKNVSGIGESAFEKIKDYITV